MINHISFSQLGKANHGWLNANHHFSFARYYNPQRMGFGALRVINDDVIAAQTGFDAHPHDNMEIITYVRSGAVSHRDSMGNQGVTKAGQVQVMSAGTGIVHEEHNLSDEELTLYQIWIEPKSRNVKPQWGTKNFPTTQSSKLPLLVSGFEEDKDALFIHQDARIYGGKVAAGTEFEHKIDNQAYVLASSGEFALKGNGKEVTMNKGDGAEVTLQKSVTIRALSDSEIVIIDAP
ncbi:MAG: pirin family protein [Psychrobium sp.]